MSVIDDIESGKLTVVLDPEPYYKNEFPEETAELLRLARIGAAMQWIPVSDHMPDISKLILLYGGSGWIGCGWLKSDGTWFIDSEDGMLEKSRAFVTHWMPLPPLPETSTQEVKTDE